MEWTWQFKEQNPFGLSGAEINGGGATANNKCYYVDSVNGNDNNTGAYDSPFRTIARAYASTGGVGAGANENCYIVLSGQFFDADIPATTIRRNIICEGTVVFDGQGRVAQKVLSTRGWWINTSRSVNNLLEWNGGEAFFKGFSWITLTQATNSIPFINRVKVYGVPGKTSITDLAIGTQGILYASNCTMLNVKLQGELFAQRFYKNTFVDSEIYIRNQNNYTVDLKIKECIFYNTTFVTEWNLASISARVSHNFYSSTITVGATISVTSGVISHTGGVLYDNLEATQTANSNFDPNALPSGTPPLFNEDYSLQHNSLLATAGIPVDSLPTHIGAKDRALITINSLNNISQIDLIDMEYDSVNQKYKIAEDKLKGSIVSAVRTFPNNGIYLIKRVNSDFLFNLFNGGYIADDFLDRNKPFTNEFTLESRINGGTWREDKVALNSTFEAPIPVQQVKFKIDFFRAYDDYATLYLGLIGIPNNKNVATTSQITNDQIFLAWNTFVIKCKIDELWDKLIDVKPFLFSADTMINPALIETAITLNAKNVGDFATINSTAPSDFSLTFKGLRKTTTNELHFLDTNTSLTSAEQNDISFGFAYSEIGSANNDQVELTNGGNLEIKGNVTSGNVSSKLNNATETTSTGINAIKLVQVSRTNPSSYIKNIMDMRASETTNLFYTINETSQAITTDNITLFKVGDSYNSNRYSFYYKAKGLTQEELTKLGRNIKELMVTLKRA